VGNPLKTVVHGERISWVINTSILIAESETFKKLLEPSNGNRASSAVELVCPGGSFLCRSYRIPLEMRTYFDFGFFVDYLKSPGSWKPKISFHDSVEKLVKLYFMGAELDADGFLKIVYDTLVDFLEEHPLGKHQLCDILDTIGAYECPEDEEEEEEGYNIDDEYVGGFDSCRELDGEDDDMTSDQMEAVEEELEDTEADVTQLRDCFIDIAAYNQRQLVKKRYFRQLLEKYPHLEDALRSNERFEGGWPTLVDDIRID
jgi:hypothetical protein